MGSKGPFEDMSAPGDQAHEEGGVTSQSADGSQELGAGEIGAGERMGSLLEKRKKRGTTVSFQGAGRSFKGLHKSILQNPKKWIWIGGVLVFFILVSLMVVGVVIEKNKAQKPTVHTTDVNGELKTPENTGRRLDNFMDKIEKKWNEVGANFEDQKKLIEKQNKDFEDFRTRLMDLDARFTKRASDLEAKIGQAKKGSDFVFANPGDLLRGSAGGGADSFDASYQGFVRTLGDEKKAGGLTLPEARIRAMRFAEEKGIKPDEALSLRDQILDKIGFLQIGNVAEPAMSVDEKNSLAPELRGLVDEVHDFEASAAAMEGKCLPRPKEVAQVVRNRLGEKAAKAISDAAIAQLATIARVRMVNCTDDQEAQLPVLMDVRDSKGIKRTDLLALERLVWERKDSLGALLPGQHVALVWGLARGDRKQGSADIQAKLTSASRDDLEGLAATAKRAIELALEQGLKSQMELKTRGRTAVERALEGNRKTLSDSEKDQLVTRALADALRKPASANPDQLTPKKDLLEILGEKRKADVVQQTKKPDEVIRLGQLSMSRSNAGRAALSMVTTTLSRLGLDPATVEGATAAAILWTAAPTIGEEAFDATVKEPLSGRAWTELVQQRFTAAAAGARRILNLKVRAPNLPEDLQEYLSNVYLGTMLGPYANDHGRAAEALQVAGERLSRSPVLSSDQIDALRKIPARNSWQRVGFVVQTVGGGLPHEPVRIQELEDNIPVWFTDRQTAIQQISQSDRLGKDMRGRVYKEVADGLYTVMPMVAAQVDDERMAMPVFKQLWKEQATLFACLSVAEAHLMDQAINGYVIRYLNMMDANTGGAKRLAQTLQVWVPEAVQDKYNKLKVPLNDGNFIDVAASLAEALLPDAERLVVREVLHARVEPRLIRAAKDLDPHGLEDAIAAVHRASDEMVQQGPYGANDIDRMAIRLTRIGMDALTQNSEQNPSSARGRDNSSNMGGPGRVATRFIDPTDVKGKELPGPPIGKRTRQIMGEKPRCIPCFSAADGHLLNGLAAEIKGGAGNLSVVFECQPKWIGAGGSYVIMPKLRVGGTVKPAAGPSRLIVELTKLAYTFPDGHTVEKPINGFVVDNVEGKNGLLAEWQTNWEKVMPPAFASGVLEGSAKALDNSNQSVQVQNGTTTMVSANNASTLERAAVGGLSQGAKVVGDYFKQFMDAVQPTVEAPNGQPVTVVLFSTVTFDDVTQAEWAQIGGAASHQGF
jgi:hypothetical protein